MGDACGVGFLAFSGAPSSISESSCILAHARVSPLWSSWSLSASLACLSAFWHSASKANADLDKVSMNKLYSAIQTVANDGSFARKASDKAYRDKSGREFFETCFRTKLLDREQLKQVISLGGPDAVASHSELDKDFMLESSACSFTAPKMGELKQLLLAKERTVLFSFNSRNARNYDSIGYGMLVAWSDGEIEYMTPEYAAEKYEITEEEWENPSQLFGKKKPFKHTFE